MSFPNEFFRLVKRMCEVIHVRYFCRKDMGWGHMGNNSSILGPSIVSGKNNVYLGDNVNIDWDNVIYATNAKFVVGDNCGIAVGFKAITGNHMSRPGEPFKSRGNNNLKGQDIVLGEDVWVGCNVTILSGVTVGRGAVIGAGSVVRKSVPPYAMVQGNPCKIVGFRFTPDEIVEHEIVLYPKEKRIQKELLEKNYDKFFLKRLKDIKEFTKI